LRNKYGLRSLLKEIGIARSSYYYNNKRLKAIDKYEEIKVKIVEINKEHRGWYGYRRITLELHNIGHKINHKTVYKLKKGLGLVCNVRLKK